MTRWIVDELGPTCRSISPRSIPTSRCSTLPATPPATLRRARAIALGERRAVRLHRQRVDTGGGSTLLPGVRALVIERDWYELGASELPERRCAAALRRAAPRPVRRAARDVGRRRLPVRLAATRRSGL